MFLWQLSVGPEGRVDGVIGGVMNVGETGGQGPPIASVLQVPEDQASDVVNSLTGG